MPKDQDPNTNQKRMAPSFLSVYSLCLMAVNGLLTVLTICTSAIAADPSVRDTLDTGTPWHISADTINYDTIRNLYIAEGDVRIAQPGRSLSADLVRFNPTTMQAAAQGNVTLTSGGDILTGSRMRLNLADQTGKIENGDLFIETSRFHITSDVIEKIGDDVYTARGVTVSTCDTDSPAWKITGKNLQVTVEGSARVSHATIWIKNIPVFYTPYFSFPVKLTRQTGFLDPEMSHSDRLGFSYGQSLFWAINQHSDATFHGQLMTQRGTRMGMEYRYVLDTQSKGVLMIDGFNDRKRDDGSFNSSWQWGYEDDSALRPNTDRYWFRMKHDQALPLGFLAELDLDIVSDQDYLHEFRKGQIGYDASAAYFDDLFGRILDPFDDPIRVNRLNVRNRWQVYSFNGEIRWYDAVIDRRQRPSDTTLHKLPSIQFDGLKQRILDTPLYVDFGTEYTHLYREEGERGHRFDAHSRLYFPYRLKDLITLEPSLGISQTLWVVDEPEDSSVQEDRTPSRGHADFRLDLTTELYRIFADSRLPNHRIKHIIRPQITWGYTSEASADTYPSFDTPDQVPGENLLTYSLTNILISGSEEKDDRGENPGRDRPRVDYHQFFRLKIEQSYDIDGADDPGSEPFSPIRARLEIRPLDHLAVDIESQWSPYGSGFVSHSASLALHDERGDRLFVEYRFEADIMESVYGDFKMTLTDRLSAYGDYERNLHDKKRIRQGLGLLYEERCWSLDVRYSEEANDRRVGLVIHLYGLGELTT
ncbi:MAG: LPS assembly protein LptD [Desulfobacterales bacterium]